ncbi:hypothetical protein I552_2542 [Mycobacterium xenopi 3993]|nr:hypothetical protein I552_2542 [Mycobacterium xenopi 3993]
MIPGSGAAASEAQCRWTLPSITNSLFENSSLSSRLIAAKHNITGVSAGSVTRPMVTGWVVTRGTIGAGAPAARFPQ